MATFFLICFPSSSYQKASFDTLITFCSPDWTIFNWIGTIRYFRVKERKRHVMVSSNVGARTFESFRALSWRDVKRITVSYGH